MEVGPVTVVRVREQKYLLKIEKRDSLYLKKR